MGHSRVVVCAVLGLLVVAWAQTDCDDATITQEDLREALTRMRSDDEDTAGDVHDPAYPRAPSLAMPADSQPSLELPSLNQWQSFLQVGPPPPGSAGNAYNPPQKYETSFQRQPGESEPPPPPPPPKDLPKVLSKMAPQKQFPASAMVLVEGGSVMLECNAGDVNARWDAPEGNSHCYMLFYEKKTFSDALWECQKHGGYLVTITNPQENKFIHENLGAGLRTVQAWEGPWIGYTDAHNEGDWRWVNGEIAVMGDNVVYTNWYPDQPDNCQGGEDCAQVSGGQWGTMWNDMKCNHQLPYICERNA